MSEPTFDATTERTYVREIPELYRAADDATNFTLKKFLSGPFGVLNQLETLAARFDYLPPEDRARLSNEQLTAYMRLKADGTPFRPDIGIYQTSDLVDPRTADAAWLPWLSQLIGIDSSNLSTEQEFRDAISSASSGFRAGSRQSLEEAAKSLLTGSRYAKVFPFSTDGPNTGTGTQWDVLVVTKTSETPGTSAEMVDALKRKNVVPAGVVIWHKTYEASWDTTDTLTWDQRDAKTWDEIESMGA